MANHNKRQSFQKKVVKQGHKSMRGVPELYDEKKEITSIGITATAKQGLDSICQNLSISRSELIERIGRGMIEIKGIKRSDEVQLALTEASARK